MKIEHLEERVGDYTDSISTVVKKKRHWESTTKELILTTLNQIAESYDIGWRVQELSWMSSNEAVNITFDSFPLSSLKETNQCPSYQFVPGGALVFTLSYSGDVYIFISLPVVEALDFNDNTIDLNIYTPQDISEKIIVEKVDQFLKEMIAWEVPSPEKQRVGFKNNSSTG